LVIAVNATTAIALASESFGVGTTVPPENVAREGADAEPWFERGVVSG
jgi:hypothetical protein